MLQVPVQDNEDSFLHTTHEETRHPSLLKNCPNREHNQPEVRPLRVRGEAGGAYKPTHGHRAQ